MASPVHYLNQAREEKASSGEQRHRITSSQEKCSQAFKSFTSAALYWYYSAMLFVARHCRRHRHRLWADDCGGAAALGPIAADLACVTLRWLRAPSRQRVLAAAVVATATIASEFGQVWATEVGKCGNWPIYAASLGIGRVQPKAHNAELVSSLAPSTAKFPSSLSMDHFCRASIAIVTITISFTHSYGNFDSSFVFYDELITHLNNN